MESKVTILFCIDTLTGGGAEKLLIQILKRFNYDVFLVDLYVMNNYGVYFDDIPPQVNWFTRENENRQLSKRYDIEIAFLEGTPTKYIAQRNTLALKIAWVHTDFVALHWTKVYYENDAEEIGCYSRMHKIVFVSNNALSQFNKKFPQINVHRQVILNLIDRDEIIEMAKSNRIQKTKLTLCSVGNLIQHKGYDRLIPIIARLVKVDQLDFNFWIVGTGQQESLLKELIEQNNLHEVVSLQGFHKNPYPFVKCSDAFISVSFSEGYPLVIAEALCLGKAIMATKVTGSTEMLDHGKAGLLVDTDDESVYDGLKGLICSADLRETLSKAAKKRAEIFDVRKTMEQIYRLFSFKDVIRTHENIDLL